MPYDREDALAALHERSRRFSEAMDRLEVEVADREGSGPPCESCGEPSTGYSLDEVPLCAHCAGALAEVATHEGGKVDLVIENLTGEEVEYAVLGPPLRDFPDPDFYADGEVHGAAVGEPIVQADSTDGPRFGSRVREWDVVGAVTVSIGTGSLRSLADAIDRDADRQAMEAAEAYIGDSRHIRQQIEQLVGELRYTVQTGPADFKDALDVEPFLERLGRIFGERPGSQPLGAASGTVEEWRQEMAATPGDFREHEPAHDRRKTSEP